MSTQKRVNPKSIAVTFVIALVVVVLIFVLLGNRRHMGIEVPVWPAVDTEVAYLPYKDSGYDMSPVTLELCGDPSVSRMPSTGFPFSDEVFDSTWCRAGTNYLAVLLNSVTAVVVAGLVTVILRLLPKRKKHEQAITS